MLNFWRKNKIFNIQGTWIDITKIWSISKILVNLNHNSDQYLEGNINGVKYRNQIIVSHIKPEYRWEEIARYEFYQEYEALYKAFLKRNNLKDDE